MMNSLSRFEIVLVALIPLLSIGTIVHTPEVGTLHWRIIYLSICMFFIFKYRGEIVNFFDPRNAVLLIFIFYLCFSALWSADMAHSATRAFAFAVTTLLAYILSASIQTHKFLLIASVSLCVGLIASAAVSLAIPSIGVNSEFEKHHGFWNGIFDHKNHLGRAASLTFFISALFISLSKQLNTNVKYHYGCCVFCMLMVYQSGSRTAFGLIAVTLIFFLFSKFIFNNVKLIFLASGLFVIFIVVVWFTSGFLDFYLVTGTANDHIYFTNLNIEIPTEGRLTIWEFAISELHSWQTILGFGIGGFWGVSSSSVLPTWLGLGTSFTPGDSHNGFIDVYIQLGFLGVFLYALLIKGFTGRTYTIFSSSKSLAMISISYFLFFIFGNFTEAYFAKSTNFLQFIFFFLYFKLSTGINETRSPRRQFKSKVLSSEPDIIL